MSDIVSPTSLHADLRSASRSYNRDKNHTSKWSLGPRPGRIDVNQAGTLDSAWTANAAPTHVKIVPEKGSGRSSSNKPNVSTKNRGISHYATTSANLRLTRKSDALRETTSKDSISRSLADLLPSTSTSIPIQRNEVGEGDVLYSFDKKSSPSESVGLGGLIENAERKWREKETVRLVRSEWEVLDGEGEREGRRGRRAGVKDVVVKGGGLGDDEDYELV